MLMLLPVTSASVERANSALSHVKSALRSTMTNIRLNGLLLLSVHQDIPVNRERIVDIFARRYPTSMRLLNALGDCAEDDSSEEED